MYKINLTVGYQDLKISYFGYLCDRFLIVMAVKILVLPVPNFLNTQESYEVYAYKFL